MKTSITRAAVMSTVAMLVAISAVFMAVPANASAPAPVTHSSATAARPSEDQSAPRGGFECVAYLKLFGYRITTARTLACGASYINKPVCIAGLVATRVRLSVATPACIL